MSIGYFWMFFYQKHSAVDMEIIHSIARTMPRTFPGQLSVRRGMACVIVLFCRYSVKLNTNGAILSLLYVQRFGRYDAC